jgi:hypothetical protein
MTHLPLCWAHTDHCHLQCTIIQNERRLLASTVIKEQEALYVLFLTIMSFIMNLMICVGMILLYLLQCLFNIVVIDLFSTSDSVVVSFFNSLVIFMIYFWIKIKLKVLLFPTIATP